MKIFRCGKFYLFILLACCLIYLYLYTNVLDGIKTSGIYRVVEGDLQAAWKDEFDSISYYLKLMKKDPENIRFQFSASTSRQDANFIAKQSNVVTTSAKELNKAMLINRLKDKIQRNTNLPLLTLFTSWNENREKYLVHNLTVRNWLSLRPFVIPVIFTNQRKLARNADVWVGRCSLLE